MSIFKKHMDTLSEQMSYLKENGFATEFSISDDKIKSNNGKEFSPEDLVIREVYRFEGESNPADSSDLFAVELNTGEKGLLVTAHGPDYLENAELIKKIRVDRTD